MHAVSVTQSAALEPLNNAPALDRQPGFPAQIVALRGAQVPWQPDGDPQGTLPRTLTVTAGEIVLDPPR